MNQHRLAIFASGKGSNALNIITYFKKHPRIKVTFLLCNKLEAPIVQTASKKGIKVIVITNEEVEKADLLLKLCVKHHISTIILAGFLRKLPQDFVQHYPKQIINIHPSLLPKYGGEGMYGKFVHEAVLANQEQETGISIHFVNEEYDKGKLIAQFKTKLNETETLESIQEKIHALEMKHFPKTIEQTLLKK
jgi:phosphoribosylglycinamide formyltransferase 1